MHTHATAATAVLTALATVAVATLALATVAPGEAQAQNRPAAEAAFRKGKDLLAAGKTADACASFEQSQKLDPQLGTEYNLALCHERLGKLASAWAVFSELSARDTNARRKSDSAKRARALEPRLTRMLIQAAGPVAGLTISQDGADVTVLLGVASPVDPGTYQFTAQAPGHRTWTQPVAFSGEGKTIRVDIPVLDVDPGAAPGPGRDDAVMPATQVTPGTRDDDAIPPDGSTRRWIGLGVGGGGAIAVGLGLVFGYQAMGLQSDADDLCGGSTDSCRSEGIDDARKKTDSASSKATLSTVFVGAGLVAVGAGVYLYVTAPSGEDERAAVINPVIGSDQLGFAVSGRF